MGSTGTTPGGHDRFPGFDVMAEAGHWDDVTRAAVVQRLAAPSPLSFFTVHEEPTVRALCDRLLGQDAEPRVPVVEAIDARLRRGDGDGYRYVDMPEDGEAWKRSLAGLDDDARQRADRRFAALDRSTQRNLIDHVRRAEGNEGNEGNEGKWHDMPAALVFGLWMRYAATAFYSHPWAWNEIGFPGPAYPRGYKATAPGRREPFEVAEVDARDPIPWVRRVEAARRLHAGESAPADGR
jgi:hypothetical protein